MFRPKTGGEDLMKFKNLAYATFVAATAVAFVIGSAVPSEAAKKKKAAAAAPPPPPPQVICTSPPGAVCATKGDQKFTYNSACWATKDGAKGAKPGACPAPKTAAAGGKKKSKKKKA
jgi:hypothetical protein